MMALLLGLTLVSCGPSYVGVNAGYGPRYRYYDRPYGYYYRPAPPVIVTPPPRVYYRSPYRYRHYRPVPPAYGRRYNNPGNRYGNGGGRGNGRWR